MLRLTFLALSSIWVCWSCKTHDESVPPIEYHLTVGDTAIVIPDSAVRYAGFRSDPNHFVFDAYILREYQVARDPHWPHPGATFSGTLIDWKALGWDLRRTFLLSPYDSRDSRTADNAQYFYWIGTFPEQFGYGWRDTYDPEANLNNADVNIWLHPADTTLAPDDPATIGFDGESRTMEHYRAMWRFE